MQHYQSSPENKLDKNPSDFCIVMQCTVGPPSIEGVLCDRHSAASLAQHVSLSTLSLNGDCQ